MGPYCWACLKYSAEPAFIPPPEAKHWFPFCSQGELNESQNTEKQESGSLPRPPAHHAAAAKERCRGTLPGAGLLAHLEPEDGVAVGLGSLGAQLDGHDRAVRLDELVGDGSSGVVAKAAEEGVLQM